MERLLLAESRLRRVIREAQRELTALGVSARSPDGSSLTLRERVRLLHLQGLKGEE